MAEKGTHEAGVKMRGSGRTERKRDSRTKGKEKIRAIGGGHLRATIQTGERRKVLADTLSRRTLLFIGTGRFVPGKKLRSRRRDSRIHGSPTRVLVAGRRPTLQENGKPSLWKTKLGGEWKKQQFEKESRL